ncbi:DEAD/DEAH box helicase (plasmid) [Paracoccus yeei]|uniref:DEAD/DEAH box helicase n=2 Tax=Paracoccus yeei TaxID=147645 RepID=A0A386UUL7_9RHOB|nr:DEAD/DEAH box helicase [Paracoccus yeei]
MGRRKGKVPSIGCSAPPFSGDHMNELTIAAPLAAALAAKGYASLTSVQQAVLAADAAGRDMLVSAQTGSGKTVAFGLAVAPDILGEGAVLLPADVPLGLAIAPTRELALQVARELEWLYAEAGARIATCVGGMDYRTERRALERGPHIVVGTPGRLRDHIERGGLDLSGLRAAVLDEADEMLDLGFREDLEFILQSAPDSRRTLMFSATVPPAIEKLAKDFQKDALRIVAQGEARQHGDIEYRAISVSVRDREPAIFNLLRLHESQTAIIFCKTRANVNHLLARMGNRGFKAVALSGELSQQERTHALQALRDGRARVCIATDVAARGIDLPGLELVIHADLPTNAETLLHRSGRTGRAGSKGVSALIVVAPEYKKAQRLLKTARVEATWGGAPSADEVRARDDQRMLEHPALAEPAGDEAEQAADLVARFGAEQVAAAFIRLWREGRPAPEELTVVRERPDALAPREPRDFGDSVWFSLSVGYSGRAEARWLLPKICEAGRVTKDVIGAIKVRDHESFVQIAREAAPAFGEATELEDGLMMVRLEGMPNFERSAAPPRRETPEKKGYPRRAPAPTPEAERPAEAEAAPKKARWSTADKAAKRAAGDAAPPRDKPRGKFDQKPAGRPEGKFAGKPGWAKPGAKGKADRGGYAPKGRKA